MSTLQMLDVAIGMIFIYLLLSLICSAINELIEALFKFRASELEKGIRELLNDKGGTGGIVEKLYNHSIIAGLYNGKYKPKSRNLPSYIPAGNFAIALMDLISPATDTSYSGVSGAGAVSQNSNNGKSLAALREAIQDWPQENSRQALLTIIDSARNDVDKAKENLESWYNSSMDRVAGWYKRRVQTMLVVLGFLVAFAMNADSIAILRSLLNDPPLRTALVAAADKYASSSNSGNQTPEERVDANTKKLYSLKLPVGWDWDSNAIDKNYNNNYLMAIPWANTQQEGIHWFLKIIGWLITAIAVSFGSAFWFDTLNKVMVIRSTVKPHEKSKEESSEDRQTK